ncbi:MAG: tetratricopeptide repeat protein [Nitrospinae bacterium]|nr:tetratricopeptide repeat protein [Nitrospinota bacterium]
MDVKSPDEFLTFWDHAFHYVSDNRERLALPVIGVLVMIMLGFGFWYYQTRKIAQANVELYRVLAELPRPGSGQTATADQVIDKLKAYDARFGGTGSGRLGRLYRANFLYQKGSFDEAAALYKGIGGNDVTGQFAAINLAAVFTQQGKFADAIATLEKIRATTMFAGEADYQIARNQEAAGNNSAAKAEYAKFLEKHPGSRITAEVKERLARL